MNRYSELNYRATIVWDDMTTVVENGREISRVYEDNRVKIDWTNPIARTEE